jgi:predicted RNA-binding Zn ribbon-like protein
VYQQNDFCWYDVVMEAIAELDLVAGHPALDFLNTVEGRLGPEYDDVLRGPEDLEAWGVRAGLLTADAGRGRGVAGARRAGGSRGARAELAAALELREHLLSLLDARVAGHPADAADLRALARAVAAAHAAGALVQQQGGELRWSWDPGALATVRHTVATTASELLASPAAARIGRCDGAGCGWYFLDTTKRGNRRWCSMRECGQDAKSARRRAGGSQREA